MWINANPTYKTFNRTELPLEMIIKACVNRVSERAKGVFFKTRICWHFWFVFAVANLGYPQLLKQAVIAKLKLMLCDSAASILFC
jgi:hypothetical protein